MTQRSIAPLIALPNFAAQMQALGADLDASA